MVRFPWFRGKEKKEEEGKLYEVKKIEEKEIKKLFKKAFPEPPIELHISCERDGDCQLIASHDFRFIGREELYCLDKPVHFCTCLVRIKKGEEKILNRATIIPVDRKILEEIQESVPARFIATLKFLPEQLKIYEHAIRRVATRYSKEELKLKTTREFFEEIKREIEPLGPEVDKRFEEFLALKHDRYMAYTDLNGKFKGIIPYTPERFEELRDIMKEWVDRMQKVLKKGK